MKNLAKLLLSLIICSSFFFYGCGIPFFSDDSESEENQDQEEQESEEEKEKITRFVTQDVETFDISNDSPNLSFSKSGSLTPSKTINVIPEISGRVTNLRVEVGDRVQKGDLIAELGDSLSTDSFDIQYQSAVDSLAISERSKEIIAALSNKGIEAANINIDMSKDLYSNSLDNKRNTQDMLGEQRDSLIASMDNAHNNYEMAFANLQDAKEGVRGAEDAYYDYTHNTPSDLQDPATAQELSLMVSSSEAAVEAAKSALEGAAYAEEQAELAFNQFEESYDLQLDGQSLAIKNSDHQKDLAVNQKETAEITKDQQLLSIEAQIIQAEATKKTAELNMARKNLTAPIDGVISDILVEESEFANPGQALAVIETKDTMLVKTSVNTKEKDLIRVGDEVIVSDDQNEYNGEITEISPSLDEISKKIEVEVEVSDSGLTAGSIVSVEFQPESKRRIFVPLNSIFLLDNQKNVKTVNEDDKVEYEEVETGIILGNFIEIIDGLSDHDTVVANQSQFLREGERINPIDYSDSNN